jgi:hypothetical protein
MDIKQMQYIPGGAVSMIMHSMEFPQGNDWAKSVCSQVTRQLGDNDYAGLVVFGMDASQVYKGGMLKVGPNRGYMLTQIRGINPGDMPDFDAALQVAYDGLIKTKAYLKHCIILSDGDPVSARARSGEEVQRRENHDFHRRHQPTRRKWSAVDVEHRAPTQRDVFIRSRKRRRFPTSSSKKPRRFRARPSSKKPSFPNSLPIRAS